MIKGEQGDEREQLVPTTKDASTDDEFNWHLLDLLVAVTVEKDLITKELHARQTPGYAFLCFSKSKLLSVDLLNTTISLPKYASISNQVNKVPHSTINRYTLYHTSRKASYTSMYPSSRLQHFHESKSTCQRLTRRHNYMARHYHTPRRVCIYKYQAARDTWNQYIWFTKNFKSYDWLKKRGENSYTHKTHRLHYHSIASSRARTVCRVGRQCGLVKGTLASVHHIFFCLPAKSTKPSAPSSSCSSTTYGSAT